MVSMTDFLEILGLLGRVPQQLYSDSTRAMLDLGEMGASHSVFYKPRLQGQIGE